MSETINTNVPAVAETEGKDFIKPSGWKADKDWSYLAEKQPDASHHLKAELMNRFGPEGFEITPEQVMVFLAMHRWTQQSDVNQSRTDFRGRTLESVVKGYKTLAEKAAERIETEGPTAQIATTTHITGLKAEDLIPASSQELVMKDVLTEPAEEPAIEEAPAEDVKDEPVKEEAPKPAARQRRTPRKPATKAADLKV